MNKLFSHFFKIFFIFSEGQFFKIKKNFSNIKFSKKRFLISEIAKVSFLVISKIHCFSSYRILGLLQENKRIVEEIWKKKQERKKKFEVCGISSYFCDTISIAGTILFYIATHSFKWEMDSLVIPSSFFFLYQVICRSNHQALLFKFLIAAWFL